MKYNNEFLEKMASLERRVSELEKAESLSITEPVIASAVTVSLLQNLPALRGLWLGGPQTHLQTMADASGNAQGMVGASSPKFMTVEHKHFISVNGINEYFKIVDNSQFSIKGSESSVNTADRGLTIGGWVQFSTAVGSTEYVISKRQSTTQMSYWLFRESSTGIMRFGVSDTGASTSVFIVDSVAVPATSQWHFVVGRYDPSSEVAVFLNDVKASNTTSIPATIFDSTADLFIAGRDDASTGFSSLMTGWGAFYFVCAARIEASFLTKIYNTSRHIFGV